MMNYKCFHVDVTVSEDVSAEKINNIVKNAIEVALDNSDSTEVSTVKTEEITEEIV